MSICHGKFYLKEMETMLGEWEAKRKKAKPVIYLTGPETDIKSRFRTREVDSVIKNFAGFEPETLQPFLKRLLSRDGS
jgi:hypothetical protein